MNTFIAVVLAAALLVSFGVLMERTVTEWQLGARMRRQAAAQRAHWVIDSKG
jgi:hypothetical protein